ncbi:MAG TPA: ATP-binding cassette domain-containing protein [Gemmatimonadaceae bacterium]|nr:ATP-binding cassette domain-containing protein [Gemmatimonadaceae bacterium]
MLFFARNLAKRYAAGTDGCSVVARVLDGVDLELRAGTILGIVGGRASGKTTLLRCVAGLARPDRGALRWAPAALRPRITALAPAAHPYETVRDVASRACGDPMISPDRLAAEFAALGLSHLMARSQAALTTDERARLALAIGAATRHPLLLLDGTADALSAAARPRGRACLERVAQQGGAVLLTGRDPAAVQALAARALRLADGRLCDADAPGTPRAPARVAERGAATSLR